METGIMSRLCVTWNWGYHRPPKARPYLVFVLIFRHAGHVICRGKALPTLNPKP